MKYLSYFKENVDQENFKDDVETVFESDEWLVIRPKSYESLCFYGKDTEWRLADQAHEYLFHPEDTYININKDDDNLILFDFYNCDFCDKEEDTVYLKDFFDINNELYYFYGELIQNSNVVKEGDNYWVVIDDYVFFTDYFKLDRNTRDDFIKRMLSGEDREIFSYDSRDFDIDEFYGKLNDKNLLLLKTVLRLERNFDVDYDYDVNGVKNYDDITSIVKEYDLEELKKFLRHCVCEAREDADSCKAYEEITDEIYDFFNLEIGSAKWQKYKNSKYDKLWIRFKTKAAAYYSKFLFNGYDDSYSDEKINYYSKDYYGDLKDLEISFNDAIENKIFDFDSANVNYSDIKEFLSIWNESKEKNPSATEEEIEKDVDFYFNAKKYNL